MLLGVVLAALGVQTYRLSETKRELTKQENLFSEYNRLASAQTSLIARNSEITLGKIHETHQQKLSTATANAKKYFDQLLACNVSRGISTVGVLPPITSSTNTTSDSSQESGRRESAGLPTDLPERLGKAYTIIEECREFVTGNNFPVSKE